MSRRTLAALAALVFALGAAAPAHAAAPDTTPPSVPAGLEATSVTEDAMTLHWDPSTDDVGVAGYHVRWLLGDVLSGGYTTWNQLRITGLSRWNTYVFWVHALDAAGNRSEASEWFEITRPGSDRTPPGTPGPAAASGIGATAATLTWGASSDDGGIRAYEIVDASGTVAATVLKQRGSPTAWRLTGLTPATEYTFAVRARDNAGHASGLSEPATFTTLPQPG